jgi:hypothetical protein
MCITSSIAELHNTIIGSWDIQHPTYGYRHVLAYQNEPVNLAAGANCMFLHVPTANPLIPNQLVDTSKSPRLLAQLLADLKPKPKPKECTRSLSGGAEQNHIVKMGVYHVALLNDLSETAALETLSQIPEDKRPVIAPHFFEFYAKTFPKYRLVLACFNNTDLKTASAILVHYVPLFPKKLFFPLLEAHDGGLPRLGEYMLGYRILIFGGHAASTLIPVNLNRYAKHLRPFLPQYADFKLIMREPIPNQDEWLTVNEHWNTIYRNCRKWYRRFHARFDKNQVISHCAKRRSRYNYFKNSVLSWWVNELVS